MTLTFIEYLEPVSPGNRRLWDCEGPCIFEATREEFHALVERLPASGPLRVVELEYARKAGLLRTHEMED